MFLQKLEKIKTKYAGELEQPFNYEAPVQAEELRYLKELMIFESATHGWLKLLNLLIDGKSSYEIIAVKRKSVTDKIKNFFYQIHLHLKHGNEAGYYIRQNVKHPKYESIPIFGPIEKRFQQWNSDYRPFSREEDDDGNYTHFFDKANFSSEPIHFLLYLAYRFYLNETLDQHELDAAVKYHIIHVVYLASITHRLNEEQFEEVITAYVDFDDFNLEAMINIFKVQQSFGITKEDILDTLYKQMAKATYLGNTYRKINILSKLVKKIVD